MGDKGNTMQDHHKPNLPSSEAKESVCTNFAVQQNLIAQVAVNLLNMSAKKPTQLSIVSLLPLDIGKAYNSGIEIAKATSSIFAGIFIWGLANNRDAQYLFFYTNPESINAIIERVKSELCLLDKNLLFSVSPSPEYIEKPAPSIMTS